MEQIFQNIFNQLSPTLTVNSFPTAISDLLVSDSDTDLKFIVSLKKKDTTGKQLQEYLDKVAEAIYEQGAPNLPVVLCVVDDKKLTASVALVVEWRFGTPIINKHISFIPLTEKQWPVIIDNIKAADSTIRVLDATNCMVVKHVLFSYGNESKKGTAQLVYLRTLRPGYIMKQHQSDSQKQEFEKYLKGIPEEDYPSDKIDECVLKTVEKVYGEAKINSKLLIFSTELNDLKRNYQNGLRYEAWLNFIPMNCNYQVFEGLNLPVMKMDLFVDPIVRDFVPQQGYTCDDYLANSKEELYELTSLLKKTVRCINEMIM